MPIIRIALVAATVTIAGLFANALFQSRADATRDAHSSAQLLRLADNTTPDGTETQDPEQQEQQQENQQLCGNPNGCG